MPQAVSRMHPSHMSNPFAHLNPQHSIPQSGTHYQSQSASLPPSLGGHHAFSTGSLNGFMPSGYNMANSAGGQGLASVAAQQGFARGAAMQEQTHHQAQIDMGMKAGLGGRIRDVWKSNLEQEMVILRQLVVKYPYVSMDAEFPGIVARPIGNFSGSKAEYHYQTLRCNVDLLKPIQLGITVWTPEGELPPQQPDSSVLQKSPYPNNLMYCPCTWTFNFQFNLDEDMFAETSIKLLQDSGVDFERHKEMGIDLNAFGSVLTTSGLAFDDSINWLSFHSGYDFAYLMKILTAEPLPKDQQGFFELVNIFFPRLWDIKFLLRHAQHLRQQGQLNAEGTRVLDALGQKSGLQDLADELGCTRVGSPHTGGSDSWMTGSVFWAMKQKIFDNSIPAHVADQIYGLHGVPNPASQAFRQEFLQAQQATTPQQMPNGAYHSGHTPGQPSTPTTSHSGLSSQPTPGPHYGHGQAGSVGGAFGSFQYGK